MCICLFVEGKNNVFSPAIGNPHGFLIIKGFPLVQQHVVRFIMLKQQLLVAFFLISCISEVQRPISHFTVTFNKNEHLTCQKELSLMPSNVTMLNTSQ